jgi:hypothetical protein
MDSYQQRKEAYLKYAGEIAAYYQELVEWKGDKWLLGLYMAKEWVRFLQSSHPDFEELKLFARMLEAERYNQGSRWADLCVQVARWIAEVEDTPDELERRSV